MIMNARSSNNYSKKGKTSNLNYDEPLNKKGGTVALPDIGSDYEVISKLKELAGGSQKRNAGQGSENGRTVKKFRKFVVVVLKVRR